MPASDNAEGSPTRPVLIALAVCDVALRDIWTNKLSLIGLFTNIHSREFPFVHPSLTVYISLTNLDRPTPLVLRLIGPGEAEGERRQIATENFFADVDRPGIVMDGTMTLEKLPFDFPGVYQFQLYAGTELVGERRFIVSLLANGEEGDDEDDHAGADSVGEIAGEQSV